MEFTDYQCPFCSRFHTSAFEQLKTDYIDTGLVRFVSRDLPLPFHGQAMGAAKAARCAGDQNPEAYWQMRHLLLVNSSALSRENMLTYAQDLSLNVERFTTCLDSDQHLTNIQRDVADASTAGLTGTPSFVLGTASGNTVAGPTIIGAQPYEAFEAQIKQLLPADPRLPTDRVVSADAASKQAGTPRGVREAAMPGCPQGRERRDLRREGFVNAEELLGIMHALQSH